MNGKFIKNKSKANYQSSLLTGGSICGVKIEAGTKMMLDGKWEVTVKSQGIFKKFSIVQMGSKEFEVVTDRLKPITDGVE